jgi:Tol biopolymer transport system component
LIIKNVKTNERRSLTTLSESIESKVSWSPNGEKILYNDSSSEAYTIWPDGSHRTVISDGDSYAASWSPDGKKIAFIEDPEDDHISISEEDGTVVWVPIEKNEYQTIGAPLWSPDGTTLLFTMSRQEAGNVKIATYLLKLTGDITKLVDGELLEASWQAKQ